ncbi:hypothetical protein EDB83DRAFT_2321011 [Lactarius deliciosus]|nr:hypothetical protein EDB83DRAFT_2321011 [Lactarius deliciosus]
MTNQLLLVVQLVVVGWNQFQPTSAAGREQQGDVHLNTRLLPLLDSYYKVLLKNKSLLTSGKTGFQNFSQISEICNFPILTNLRWGLRAVYGGCAPCGGGIAAALACCKGWWWWRTCAWQSLEPYPMKKDVALFYCDPLKCIQSILSNPLVNDYIAFTPFHVYESASELPDGATLLRVVLSSDKTNISAMTSGRVAHPLLMSLANLHMDFHMKGTNHAFLLLALLPVPNSEHLLQLQMTCGVLENRMVHECLDFILTPLKKATQFGIMMSDPLGSLCYVFTPLASYIVDVAEVVVLAGVGGKTSHVTMASHKQFGNPFRHEPRTASTTLA